MVDNCSGETTLKALDLAYYIYDVTDYLRMRSEHMILKANSKRELVNKEDFVNKHPEIDQILKEISDKF